MPRESCTDQFSNLALADAPIVGWITDWDADTCAALGSHAPSLLVTVHLAPVKLITGG